MQWWERTVLDETSTAIFTQRCPVGQLHWTSWLPRLCLVSLYQHADYARYSQLFGGIRSSEEAPAEAPYPSNGSGWQKPDGDAAKEADLPYQSLLSMALTTTHLVPYHAHGHSAAQWHVSKAMQRCIDTSARGGATARLVGVQHQQRPTLEAHVGAAEAVLDAQPRAVCVETPPSPNRSERLQTLSPTAVSSTVFSRGGDNLMGLYGRCVNALSLADDPVAELREQAASGIPTEQLAYVASLACGATIVNADRPKRVTYSRFLRKYSAAALDSCFASQAERFVRFMRSRAYNEATSTTTPRSPPTDDAFEEACIRERDIVMAASIASTGASFAVGTVATDASESSRDDATGAGSSVASTGSVGVVAVVGDDHIDSLLRLLADDASGEDTWLHERAETLQHVDAEEPPPEELPIRRAIAEAVLNLRAPSAVVNEAIGAMDELYRDKHDVEQYLRAREAYMTGRMLVESMRPAIRQCFFETNSTFESIVQHARPVNGGNGPTEEDIDNLRAHLNIERYPFCLEQEAHVVDTEQL